MTQQNFEAKEIDKSKIITLLIFSHSIKAIPYIFTGLFLLLINIDKK